MLIVTRHFSDDVFRHQRSRAILSGRTSYHYSRSFYKRAAWTLIRAKRGGANRAILPVRIHTLVRPSYRRTQECIRKREWRNEITSSNCESRSADRPTGQPRKKKRDREREKRREERRERGKKEKEKRKKRKRDGAPGTWFIWADNDLWRRYARERDAFKNRPSPRPGCLALSRRTKKKRERERGEIERDLSRRLNAKSAESRRVSCQLEGFEPIKDRKKQRRLGWLIAPALTFD